MPYTDASAVLLKKFATYLPDQENLEAADIVLGYARPSRSRPGGRLEVGVRLCLPPEVLWVNAHALGKGPLARWFPVGEILRREDESSGPQKNIHIRL
ncbi:hypothetical protein [Curtobacterium sp. MCBD17_008]|uniref:hypothetical protein n=1 Tax=Curtobacterium sp. MCBD17_008 TaxID=2175656 RepID=UPI000DAAC8B2|nr:hypothetical protein [Curtobacterium sp. MCBD17_008]PZE88876.1 hypothetical protein DEI95_14735 [Curtobacterium sp. MCBD17_008]